MQAKTIERLDGRGAANVRRPSQAELVPAPSSTRLLEFVQSNRSAIFPPTYFQDMIGMVEEMVRAGGLEELDRIVSQRKSLSEHWETETMSRATSFAATKSQAISDLADSESSFAI